MSSNLFRFNCEVSAIDTGRDLQFYVDVAGVPLQSMTISWERAAEFVSWCRDRRAEFALVADLKPFSQKLDAACLTSSRRRHRPDNAAGLARLLGVSAMCIYHWRHGDSLPSEEQAHTIARHLRWNLVETLSDLRNEMAQRAAGITRNRAGRKRK
jgi:hypothetical protein